MSTRSTPKAELTRQRVLDAALELFRQKGFDQTTMRDIAAAAGLGLGSAYYHFESKEALVMAFYRQAQAETEGEIAAAMAGCTELEARIRVILDLRFQQFAPNRGFLGALLGRAADPEHPLSPFSEATREIREASIAQFDAALAGGDVRIPKDLRPHLPRLLWLYHMGLILFWINDRSEGQARTRRLVDKSLTLVVGLIRFSGLPLMKPLRTRVLDLLGAVLDPGEGAGAKSGEAGGAAS